MFGIIYSLISGVAATFSGINGEIENYNGKKRGKQRLLENENPNNSYYDRLGRERNLDTNRYCERRIFKQKDIDDGFLYGSFPGCIEGDIIIIDSIKRSFVKNISEEKRKDHISNQSRNQRTVVESGINDMPNPGKYLDNKKGKRYIDLETGELYLIRKLPVDFIDNKAIYCIFYISEKTGKIIREADIQQLDENERKERGCDILLSIEKKNQFIKEFNHLQELGGWNKLKYQELLKAQDYDKLKYIKYNSVSDDVNKEYSQQSFYCNEYNWFDIK